MATPHDEELLEWHATGQLVTINVESGETDQIGRPAMIYGFDFAPNGQYSRVELLQKPFSYIVPVNNFGRVEQLWSRSGNLLADLDKTEMNTGLGDRRPSAPGVAGSGDVLQKRQIRWAKDTSLLTFLQREEQGDGDKKSNDQVLQWAPPFEDSDLSVLYQSASSISSHSFSQDYEMLFVTESNPETGDDQNQITQYAIDLSDAGNKYLLAQYKSDDFYSNPGSLLMASGKVPVVNRRGSSDVGNGVVQTSIDGQNVFFYGHDYNADPMQEGPKNFLDKVEILTGEKERVYESSNQEQYERIVSVLDIDQEQFVVSRETPTGIPQSYLLANGRRTQLTANIDYTPDLTNAPRRRFVVERPDGFNFMVNVLLPSDYNPGTRLPAMFWFYPREYEDQESYDEAGRTYNKNAFPNFGTRSIQYRR
jgi:dipeptidyl aminopeptidase/acylaminoacyl peptidase